MKGNACKTQMLLYPLETSGLRDAAQGVFCFCGGVAGLGSDTVDIDIGIL